MMECLTDGDPLPKTRWTRVEENGREMVLDLPRFKVVSGKGNLYKIKLQMNKDYLYLKMINILLQKLQLMDYYF